MKVLFLITETDTIGKTQVHLKDLAIALQQNSHQVLVLTGKQGVFNQDLQQEGIESSSCQFLRTQINPFLDGKSLRYILYVISEFKPDLIATHSSKTGILGRLASKVSQIPCVCTVHQWSFSSGMAQPHRTIYRMLEKATASLVDKIICVTESDRKIGLKVGMIPERLITIHNRVKDIDSNLIDNESTRASMDMLNRQEYESEYTFQHMYDKTFSAYQEVIKKPKDPTKKG